MSEVKVGPKILGEGDVGSGMQKRDLNKFASDYFLLEGIGRRKGHKAAFVFEGLDLFRMPSFVRS